MRIVRLTNSNDRVYIDSEDFEIVSEYNWYLLINKNNKYASTMINKGNGVWKSITMHRFLMGCVNGDGKVVDHKDRDGLNNQRSNLRICTRQQNCCNRRPAKVKTSKYLGVYLANKKYQYWVACIRKHGKLIHLGTFKDELKAAYAYDSAAKKHFGEFASLNFK